MFIVKGFFQESGKYFYRWILSLFSGKESKGSLETPPVKVANAPIATPEPTPHLPNLTYDQIWEAREKAPPMQRDDVGNRYVGLRVDWPVFFYGARRVGDSIATELSVVKGNFPRVFCDVPAAVYPQLAVLEEGAPLRVTGLIAAVDPKVQLAEARLLFHL